MDHREIVVEGVVATDADDTNLKEDAWSLALDQRAFGPRRLMVAFADADGHLWVLAHTERMDPPELGLLPCIDHVGLGAVAAVAFCDEPLTDGPPPPELPDRLAFARALASSRGIHLVDWIACDDMLFRSFQLACDPDGEWWNVPLR